MSEPLTPEEEATLRDLVAHPAGDGMTGNPTVERLLATLDAARLSHDRGADTALGNLDELRIWANNELSEKQYRQFGPILRRIEDAVAALSVPAPTLPALDGTVAMERIAEMLFNNDESIRTMDEARSYASELVREALRDAV